MKWKYLLIMFIPVILLGGTLAIMIFSESTQEDISSENFGITSYAGEEGSFPTTYTPTTETNCYPLNETHKRCSTKQYSFRPYVDESGKTIRDITTMTWLGNSFNFSHISGKVWVEIQPFAIYNGQYKTFQDLKTAFPNVNIRDYISHNEFSQKFGVDLENLDQAPPQLLQNTEYLGFRLLSSGGLTWDDVRIEDGEIIIKDNYGISFQDLKDIGYTLNLVNKTYLLIGNLSAGYSNGTLVLDPTVTLNSGNMTSWSKGQSGSTLAKKGYHITLLTNNIPTGATIVNATLWFADYNFGIAKIWPDNDLNISLYNENGTVFGSWNVWSNSRINNTIQTWINETGGSYFINWSEGRWWGANFTKQLKQRYDNGIQNLSLRFIDPDNAFTNTTSGESKDSSLIFGGISYVTFASPTYSNVSLRPYAKIVYDAEANPPEVTLFYPNNDEWINAYTPASGSQVNFTIQVEDASTIDYLWFYSTLYNSSWTKGLTNDTDVTPPKNYTFYQNLTNWFDSKTIIADQNLSDTNGRALSGNATHFFMTSFQTDQLRWFYRNGTYIKNWTLPDAWIGDTDVNDSHMAMIDVLAKKLYLTYQNGTSISSCSTVGLTSGNPYGVAFDKDNTTVWIIFEQTSEVIFHTDFSCSNLGNYPLPNSNPYWLTISGDIGLFGDQYTNPDQIIAINLTDGNNLYNITNVKGKIGGTLEFAGIFVDKNDTYPETIYLTGTNPNELTYIKRIVNGTGILWNCYACDIYTNCAWATENFTFRITNDTIPENCWTLNGKQLYVPSGCVYYQPGSGFI